MSLAQFLMPAFRFGTNDPKEALRLADAGVSGFCLYGGDALEVASFTRRLARHSGRPLLFASDFENGAGSQISDLTELVSNMGIGQSNNDQNARLKGLVIAEQAKILGINWIFAPVVDLYVRKDNPIVNIRSFGKNPELVSKMAQALIEPIEKNRLAACLKHYPGHGDTDVDSHLHLARIKRPLSTLLREDMLPYRALLKRSSSVMSCHLIHPQIDAYPASLSPKWINSLLRQQLGFNKIVITDALMMGAITQNFAEEDYLRLGLEAGNDILLYPPNPWSALKSLKKLESRLEETKLIQSQKRITALLKRLGQFSTSPMPSAKAFNSLNLIHQKTAQKIAKDCLLWHREPAEKFSLKSHSLRYLEVGNKKINLDLILKTLPQKKTLRQNVLAMHDKTQEPTWAKLLISSGLLLNSSTSGPKDSALLISIFHKPRAFSGTIGLAFADLKKIKAALKFNPKAPVLVVSFGDPETLNQLPKKLPSLLTFSDSWASQMAVLELLQ